MVVSSEMASSLPMLDVPGSLENHRLPNAVAVVQAEKRHRPRQHRLQQPGLPLAPRHDVVDLERHADAEQKRQRDDVGEVERQIDRDRRFPA